MIFEEMQLVYEIERDRIEVGLFISSAGSARQNSTHEALCPSQVVATKDRIGPNISTETLTRSCAQPDNFGLGRLRLNSRP